MGHCCVGGAPARAGWVDASSPCPSASAEVQLRRFTPLFLDAARPCRHAYELATDVDSRHRFATAFAELALAV